eukprot:c25276_g3_i23 orf=353-631(+)
MESFLQYHFHRRLRRTTICILKIHTQKAPKQNTPRGVNPPSNKTHQGGGKYLLQQKVLSLLHMDPPRERTHRGRIILRTLRQSTSTGARPIA